MNTTTPTPPALAGIDQPHNLHKATLQEATTYIAQVLGKHLWLRRKAANLLELMRPQMQHLPSLEHPQMHSPRWYAVQLMKAYLHKHSLPCVQQGVEQLYEVLLPIPMPPMPPIASTRNY